MRQYRNRIFIKHVSNVLIVQLNVGRLFYQPGNRFSEDFCLVFIIFNLRL